MSFDPVEDAGRILNGAIERYNPSHVFGCFSGGHDSLCATHVASRHPRFSGAIHINTGIGIEETRRFVRETCQAQGWPLKEYSPPISYRDLVLRWGFPGPAGHSLMYQRLKERCLRQFVREHKTHRRDKIMLVTGVRRAESRRRMGTLTEVDPQGAQLWTAVIVNWEACHKEAYMAQHALKPNRVTQLLCMSGECLCGAFAKPGELNEIGYWFPEVRLEIEGLEAEARAAGVHAVWGTRPPKKGKKATEACGGVMCHSCDAKLENLEDAGLLPSRE